MHIRRRPSWIRTLAAPLLATSLLTACVPGMSTGVRADAAAQGPVVTRPGAIGPARIRVLDYFGGGPDKAWMIGVIKAFEKKYPQISVSETTQGFDDIMKSLPLKLRSGSPPDIVPANNGWQSLGTLVRGNLVLDLDRYADAYGWKKSFPTSIQREHAFTPDAREMGTGRLFGTPISRGSIIEVYYNRALLKKLGAQVPRTFGEFESTLAKAKAAGITPVSLGNVEGNGILSGLFALTDALGDQEKIADFTYSHGNVPIRETGFREAVTTFKRWSDRGYLTRDYASIPYADAMQSYLDGKELFRFEYSGTLPTKPGDGDRFGSFVLPRADGGAPVATMSAASNFSITAKTKHPDAAAAFLNFAASPEAARIAVEAGAMPMLSTPRLPAGHEKLMADEVANVAQVEKDDTAVPYMDWATPTLVSTMTQHMQDLLAHKTSVTGVVNATQDDYAKFRKEQRAQKARQRR
ncbi:ABC transporter substrate-binding protein [Streptomyces sp. NPDC056601]|uniref:ABC transporter substrate-binding protein n=1 Tax=Streptomyces sp. NPDC056601 TaxID=3345875 RepID=UPI003673FE5C